MSLTNNEELTLKKWIVWQKQASLTNDIHDAMFTRMLALGKDVTAEDLAKDSVYQALKIQRDNAAAACEPLLAAFKTTVKEV